MRDRVPQVGATHDARFFGPPTSSAPDEVAYTSADGLGESEATLDLDLGSIPTGETVTFTLFYGLATTPGTAEEALSTVGADVSYVVRPDPFVAGQSSVGVFAYRAAAPVDQTDRQG